MGIINDIAENDLFKLHMVGTEGNSERDIVFSWCEGSDKIKITTYHKIYDFKHKEIRNMLLKIFLNIDDFYKIINVLNSEITNY
jgi:hypothetical protein